MVKFVLYVSLVLPPTFSTLFCFNAPCQYKALFDLRPLIFDALHCYVNPYVFHYLLWENHF